MNHRYIVLSRRISTFALCAQLGRPTFGLQYIKSGKSKHCLARTLFKEYSTSFRMICRLIDFGHVVLKLLMFKVCLIIGISKIEFLNFSGTERVKIKTYNLLLR